MERKKLISLRVDINLLKKVDEIASTREYLTRSSLIEKCICAVLKCTNMGSYWKIIDSYDPYAEGLSIKVE